MDEQKRPATQRRKRFERLDFLAASSRQCRFVLEKERDVRTECRGNLKKFFRSERPAEQLVQREQRRRSVAAAAAESGGERDFFLQMDFYAGGNLRRREKRGGRAVNEVFGIGRQAVFAAGQLNPYSAALENEFVKQVHRLHDGFEFVKAVGAPAEDVQQQVDLAGRFFFEPHQNDFQPRNTRNDTKRLIPKL